MRAKILGSALVALLLTASAYANVVFTLGNPGHQPGEENILFHTAMTGNPIFGFTNGELYVPKGMPRGIDKFWVVPYFQRIDSHDNFDVFSCRLAKAFELN